MWPGRVERVEILTRHPESVCRGRAVYNTKVPSGDARFFRLLLQWRARGDGGEGVDDRVGQKCPLFWNLNCL